MPFYQNYTFTTANQYLRDFAAFAAGNGWIIDYNDVYLTSYWRLHFHKGAAHFEMRSGSATVVYLSSCTGYTPGAAPTAQPGYCGNERSVSNTVDHAYWFVSTVGAIYFTRGYDNTFDWGAVFIVSKKVGNWTDGHGFVTTGTTLFLDNSYTNPYWGQLYYEGGWSTNVVAGGLCGSNVAAGNIWNAQPLLNNAGIVPIPVLLMLGYPLDSTKRVPLGFAPGFYRTNGGDIYNIADELVIGSDTYLIMPGNAAYIGSTSGENLFKLGA